jgi:hypothetical protein
VLPVSDSGSANECSTVRLLCRTHRQAHTDSLTRAQWLQAPAQPQWQWRLRRTPHQKRGRQRTPAGSRTHQLVRWSCLTRSRLCLRTQLVPQ